MALAAALVRSCSLRLISAKGSPALLGTPTVNELYQRRTIVTKEMLNLPDDHAARDPWPYQEKSYSWFHAIYDRTKKRFNVNSKLITVEGNVGCDKSAVAKELADCLGFYYIPEFKVEKLLVDRYGNDMRNYYHLFPKRFRFFDDEMFYKNPTSDMSAVMRDFIFQCRFDEMLNALAHILNTGQGVVMENCIYTDFVFANAMRAKNYIGPEYFKYYYYLRKKAMTELFFWPHLVLYLDTPVDVCMEKIKKEGNVSFFSTILHMCFRLIKLIPLTSDIFRLLRHSKVLIYDWSEPGNIDTIVEDIEGIDFDFFEWHNGDVFETWHAPKDEMDWTERRINITQKYYPRLSTFDNVPKHEVGELYINPRDLGHYVDAIKKEVLKSPYGYGFIRERGDKVKGIFACNRAWSRPKPWYDYYLREAWYDNVSTMESGIHPFGGCYNPDYLHGH
uniref:NADH dehydrogenase [ubiquinone] 1 alpha subcomplex subunit 10, mitochondrial n=1 Tax=Syphacia muris TaxID=451379 RepID=A0A0N5AP34_9BILA